MSKSLMGVQPRPIYKPTGITNANIVVPQLDPPRGNRYGLLFVVDEDPAAKTLDFTIYARPETSGFNAFTLVSVPAYTNQEHVSQGANVSYGQVTTPQFGIGSFVQESIGSTRWVALRWVDPWTHFLIRTSNATGWTTGQLGIYLL